jgi:hypothetical protein
MLKYHNIKQWPAIITVTVFAAAILASCTKNFVKENTPYNGPVVATIPQLYVGIGANLDANAEGMDNTGARWLYPITQLGAVYAVSDYPYGSGANWGGFYQNLVAMGQMITKMHAEADSATYDNAEAMVRTLRAYQALELSNLYGDMPYSKAAKAFSGSTADLKAPYDKQQAIYLSCLSDLTWAVNHFNTNANQYSFGSSEFLLKNNIGQWIKFANSLRLRYALTMYDKDNADAGPIIADALTRNGGNDLLSDPIVDVVGLYSANVTGGLNFASRLSFFNQESRARMGSTLWKLFSNNNNTDGSGIFDLRCKIFFEPKGDTTGDKGVPQWIPYPQDPPTPIADGGDPYNNGRDANWSDQQFLKGNEYSNYNYYWGRDGIDGGSTNPCPEIFMSAAETDFLKAEAYARGAGVAQNNATAEAAYNAGIAASLTFWKNMAFQSSVWVVNKPTSGTPTSAELDAVTTNSKVAWSDSNGLSLIYAQEWIDLFRQPWVAWALMRRTGNATPQDTDNPAGYTQNYGSFQRFTYPGDEKQYNFDNWNAETGGTEYTSTKIWIAK